MNLASVAMGIAGLLDSEDVVFLADDEQQAEALAAAIKALLPNGQVYLVPSSDALPGDPSPATPANAGRRVAALRALRSIQAMAERPHLACILSGEAAGRRYAHPEAFDSAPPKLRLGDKIVTETFSATLAELGYFADDRVDEPGEAAVRGDIIDVFPADADGPARIELADGAISSIRAYDPVTQRTVSDLDYLEIGRAVEPAPAHGVSILAHLPAGVLAVSAKAQRRRLRFIDLAHDAAGNGNDRPIDALEDAVWHADAEKWRILAVAEDAIKVPRFAESRNPLATFVRFVRPLLQQGRRLVMAGSARDLRFLRPRIARRLGAEFVDAKSWAQIVSLDPGAAALIAMPVDSGFVDDRLVFIAAADIMGSRALTDAGSAHNGFSWTGINAEVRIGDVVVHEDHGVGVVRGLEIAAGGDGAASEMIALEYANGARRLVAIDEADRIWRYGADAEAVTLDKLDGSSWLKRRSAIDAAITESAKGLAALAQARALLEAPVMEPDAAAYERFAGGFAFNETADQARAISAVRDDLARGRPMDRLVIGDVGYGKTEVALRAAAIAAMSGYQVVIAAPTTVLVRQHLETFRRRFAASGIVVAGLSRLSTAAEKKAVKAGLADGSVHIVVGTGAVMAKGITYAKLGLVVIDEEQRFGAADKAKLRGSGDVHLLSLSATPIPRTLQSALVGLQQMSQITTPPARRQPIRTSIDQYDDARVRTALLREKARGGQSFVVVPRIEDMAALAEKLHRIVPDLTVVEAHGRMPAAVIDEVMVGFADGQGDILLATNIIEAGLDVPRANTMIIWRADRFGLAQLHQLRGRVGRGNRRGQIILLTGSDDAIGPRTLKRLRALATFDRLGAGFEISAQDLDMRGAGDLLGEDQAGHIKLIGVDLYQHLLGAALRQARGEDVEHWAPELNFGSAGAFPVSCIPEEDVRLTLYMRLARIQTEAALDAFEEELMDRFGPLPPEAEILMDDSRIRIAARSLGVQRIDAGPAAIALTPRRDFTADVSATRLVRKNGRLLLAEKTQDNERRSQIRALLETLGV